MAYIYFSVGFVYEILSFFCLSLVIFQIFMRIVCPIIKLLNNRKIFKEYIFSMLFNIFVVSLPF